VSGAAARDAGLGAWRAETNGEHDAATGIRWFRDEASGNLLVRGCHPTAARRGHSSGAAFDERTVLLARDLLPRVV
jgi:hypothetical protein